MKGPQKSDGLAIPIPEDGFRLVTGELAFHLGTAGNGGAQLEAELADTRLLQVSTQLIQEENIEALYEKVLDAAVAIMRSDYASMQMLYPERGTGGELRLLAFRGFNPQAAKFWEWVSVDSGSTCSVALRCGKRIIVPDVEKCHFMAGTDDLATYLQTGIHAVQSTPLLSRKGKVVGMLSTHWSTPHEPSERSLHLLDILARQAADLIEQRRAEQALVERARLLDLSYEAVIVRDEADRVTFWNKGASELYGYSQQEAMGRITHQLLRTEFPEPLARICKHLHDHQRWTGELIHTRKDGTLIVVMSRWALEGDGRGGQLRILETNNDITQRKEDEKALRASEERLRALTNNLETQVRIRTEELEQRNREVVKQSEQLRELSHRLMKVQDEEKRRIARELHDSAGQILGALSANLGAVVEHTGRGSSEVVRTALEGQRLVEELSKEIRTTSYLLHPPLLDECGLPHSLSWYIDGLKERSGLDIALTMPADFGRLSREMELTIFRIVQECLTNVHRHSGSKVARIYLRRADSKISLDVEDTGKGIPHEKLVDIRSGCAGVGIQGIRERVLQFGGEMKIESDDCGTRVSITLPCVKTLRREAV